MTHNIDAELSGKITVVVDPEIKDIIPMFLENRHGDVKRVLDALEKGDYETIRILGHSLQGAGGGYGFYAITALGKSLNEASRSLSEDSFLETKTATQ